MSPACQKCRKQKPGKFYEIFTADPAFDSDHCADQRVNQLTGKTFCNFQGDQMFICDSCCLKTRNKETIGFLWIGGFLLLACGTGSVLSLIDMLEGKNLGLYGTAGTILVLVLIPVGIYWMFSAVRKLFRKDFSRQHGEATAWAIKQKHERRNIQTIWTRTNFETCFGANLQPAQRASVTEGIRMTRRDQ